MFTDDDANEDDGAGGQTRYPVMPSLVALQQMKNRLHLAFLGKKLMKWTAMATSKELRKLAMEMNVSLANYGEDFAKAFMLLARCRYFCPHLNAVVIHNVDKKAAALVETDYRSVAGVKVLALELVEQGFDPNEHLGIARGGATIQETKKCWRELLKLVVLMLEQRTDFSLLFNANKAATKKQNVLAKLVIPKIQKAIAYINSELEEREREETFRLKRFKQTKDKKTLKKKEATKLIDEEPYVEAEPDIIVVPSVKPCACALAHPNQFVDQDGKFDCPICKLADKNVAIKIAPCTLCLPEVTQAQHRLKHLMAHVNQVLLLSKQYLLAETSPCCKEGGKDNEGGELSYVNVKKQLEFISVTCTCPHKELDDTKSDDSCTCKPPCRCDEPPKFKDCCGGSDKADKSDDGRSGSEFQTYNLCSIYGSSSCPQSMANGSNFRNSSKNYPAVPPFFYLYSGPYVRSETGFHSIQPRSAKSSKKGLDDALYKNELTQVKPPCPCAPLEEKKTCSCEALSAQPSKDPCICDSTEILPTQKAPSRQSEAVGHKEMCPSCQLVSSLHTPNPTTDLAQRITRLSEPCLKMKLSVSSYLPATEGFDPETAKNSRNNLKPDTRYHPIKKSNANIKVTTSSTKRLIDDNDSQTKTCSCKSLVDKISSEIMSGQSSEDLCSCDSTETLVPIVLQPSRQDTLPQSDVVEMICKGIFQTDQPATSLPPPFLSLELAERVAKASEPYFKKKSSRSNVYPADESEEIPKYPACYLKSVLSKKSTCSCKSLDQTKSCSCKSIQSCPCGISDRTSGGSNSSEDLNNTTSGPPYFKRPATFFTAVPQNFTPLISYTKEKNIERYDLHDMTDAVFLPDTSISNNFANQYLTFNPYTRDQIYKNNTFSETTNIAGSLNKFFPKQATYLSPYTREGKPGPCGIKEVSYVACPLSNTVSKQSSIYAPYVLKENSTSYGNDSKYSTYFPSHTEVGKQVLCGNSQWSSMGASLDNIDSQSTCLVSSAEEKSEYCDISETGNISTCLVLYTTEEKSDYCDMSETRSISTYLASYMTEEKSEYCDISETGSITKEFVAIDSIQCTTSSIHTLDENAAITNIAETSESPNAAICKDFSIYLSMNHQDTPYIVYTQQGNTACGNCETDPSDTPKFKDCSTYVTVIRKRPVPYTREGRPGPCGVGEMVYQTYFVISEDCATYVTTVPRKIRKGNHCGSLSTITTTSSPFSINYDSCSNCDTLLIQKERSDHCSICRIVKLSRQFEAFAPRRENSEYSDNLTLNNDYDFSDSEIFKICNACNPIPKHVVPYTREGIPGPCGVDERSVDSEQFENTIPYTREEIAKLCGVSETNTIVRSIANRTSTKEGIPRSCCVSDRSNITKCPCNTVTKPIPNVNPCTREGKPTNNIAGSRCNATLKYRADIEPCMRETTPGPCDFTDINHIEGIAYTQKRKPGPCCGACCIPDTNRHTGTNCINNPKPLPGAGIFTREGTPRPCSVPETNRNDGATCMKTPKTFPDGGAYPSERTLQSCCVSETNQNARAITREGMPRPCVVPETNRNDGTTCMKTPNNIPDYGLAFTREGITEPCSVTEPNNNAGAVFKRNPSTLIDVGAYKPYTTTRPCCRSKITRNIGSICLSTTEASPDVGGVTREGTPESCNISNCNAGATCMKTPGSYIAEKMLRRCCLSEINRNAGATCTNTSNTLPDIGGYTPERTSRRCCLTEANRNAGATCMKTPKTLPNIGAFTREGTPGPCGVSDDNTDAIDIKTPRTLPCDAAYTREGTAGPCGVTEINNNTGAVGMKSPRTLPCDAAYTREGSAGPCGVTEINNNTGAVDIKTPRTLPCDAAYKREGTAGPCGATEINNNTGAGGIKTPRNFPCDETDIQEATPELKVSETNKTAENLDPQPLTNNESNAHEETREPSSVSNKDQVIGFLYNTTIQPSSGFRAYTQEEISGRYGVSKSNRNAGSVRYTVRKLLSHLRTCTRETTAVPCGIPETSHITNANSIRAAETVPDEELPGPCGVNDTNEITGSLCSEDSQSLSNDELNTSKETRGPYGISNKDHIVGYFYNTSPKPSSDFRVYTREDIPDCCSASKTNCIVGSSTARKLLSDLGPYTIEEIPKQCCSSETTTGSTASNVTNNSIPNVNPFTREETPDPSCVSHAKYIAGSRWITDPRQHSNVEQYTRQGIVPSGISETNNITESDFNTISKVFAENRPIREETLGCQGSNTDHTAGANIVGAYTREGARDIAKTNGIAGSIRNILPKFFSRPYTREGIPGPCGVAEKDSRANSIPKESTNVEPYTRENRPGPCGIYSEARDFSSVSSSSSRTLESKSRAWNTNNSTIYKPGTSQLYKFEPYTRQGHRGPCGINDFTYCEAQSCMMCLTAPVPTYTHSTKDAVTYVTVVPRLVSCTRDTVPGSCSTCKRRKSRQSESNKSSAFSCKARAPHIRINDTRSWNANFPASCSSCKPAAASQTTSMLLPTYILAIPSSTKTSENSCCKSRRLSTATLGCGPSYNESKRFVTPKKSCSVCGRSASKLNLNMTSVSYLTSMSHGNSDTTGNASLKSQPCSGCGRAQLVMSCASNPSVKSIAIGTCETYCNSSKRKPIPKLSTKLSHCQFEKTPAFQQCSNCSINKDVENSSSGESTTSSESENRICEDCKINEKKTEDTGELGFGCFEIGFKKITKICKHKNPDGTITDEKRIITVETTKKRSQKLESLDLDEGTSISCCLENETNNITNDHFNCKSLRNAKSETVQGNVEIDVCPKVRCCISAQNYNAKEPTKSCLSNLLPKYPHRPLDFDNGSKCKCDKKSNDNARRSIDKSTNVSCADKQDASTGVCANLHQAKDSKPKRQGGDSSCLVPSDKICPKRYRCLDDTPKSVHKSTTSTCTDGPQDTKSEAKCSCGINTQPEPTESEDPDSGRKCDFTSTMVQESHDREQQTHDSDSAQKCECKDKSIPKSPVSCSNNQQDYENDTKCGCAKKSESKPILPVCGNRPDESDSKPKCACTKARKSLSKAAAPICPNSVQVTDNKPDDNVVFLVPSGQICANSLHVMDNIPISDCARKSIQKLIAPICANELHDTKSGMKCSCAKKAPFKPSPNHDSKPSPNNPLSKTAPVCAKKQKHLDSGTKCKCGKSSKPSNPACNNIPQETDSDQMCEYLSKMINKSTSSLCASKQQNGCADICTNPQKDSEKEPKFEDGNAVFVVPINKPCTNNCASKLHQSAPICTTKPQDIKNENKCSCHKSQSKPTVPVCANKKHDSNSDPKCKCGNKSHPKPIPICPNKMVDLDNGPKCDCAIKSPPKPTPPVCANRLEDSDSGPKCDCPNEAPPEPTPPICANRLEDSDSGPKCDCPIETPKPTSPECANRLEDTDSGPKCDCPSDSLFEPPNPGSNNKKNSGCDPMCVLASKILPMLTTPGRPDSLQNSNRKAKGNEDNFIFLALTGKAGTNTPLNPTASDYASRLEDTDSDSECNCSNQSLNKTAIQLCTNILENSDPNCDCMSKSLPEFNTPISTKDYEGNDYCVMRTGMKCVNLNDLDNDPKSISLPKLTTPICATWLQDKDKMKYNCTNKSPCKTTTPVCTNRIPDSNCDCIKLPPKSTVPMCGCRLEDSESGVGASLYEPFAPECNNANILPLIKLQNEVAGRVLDLHDVKVKDNSEEKIKTPDKEVLCSPQEVGGRVLDLHNLKASEEQENKLLSTKTTKSQDIEISCSSLQRETGIVIDLNDMKEIEKEEVNTCKNICKYDKPQKPEVQESGRVVDISNCKCRTKMLTTQTEINEIYNILHGIVGKVIDTHDIKENRNHGSKLSSKKRHNKEVCCSPQRKKGTIVGLHNNKDKYDFLKKIPSITCHGGSGMVLNLNNAKDNNVCENRLKEYTVPSSRTICKPIKNKDIALSTTDLYSKPKSTCGTISTKINDSDSCCPVKIIPKRKTCCYPTIHDASKLSIFRGVSMIDALRQFFQHSNSRTQKVQDKNICKTCYSPLSNTDEIEPDLCDKCKEKFIIENEQHCRCTNYGTEPGTPSCKSVPSPLSYRFGFSKNSFRGNAEDKHCCHTPIAFKTLPIDSELSSNCAENDSCRNDVGTLTKFRDTSHVHIIKKGKIEHGCTKCATRDGDSHSRHKS